MHAALQDTLFQRLKSVQASVASRMGVAAYTVISDATLKVRGRGGTHSYSKAEPPHGGQSPRPMAHPTLLSQGPTRQAQYS